MAKKIKPEIEVSRWLARFPIQIDRRYLKEQLIKWFYEREWLRLTEEPSDLDTRTTCASCGTELICCHIKNLVEERDDLREQVAQLKERLDSLRHRHRYILKKKIGQLAGEESLHS